MHDVVMGTIQSVAIVKTITRSGLGGLISSRDFVDLTVTTRTPQYISTCCTYIVEILFRISSKERSVVL